MRRIIDLAIGGLDEKGVSIRTAARLVAGAAVPVAATDSQTDTCSAVVYAPIRNFFDSANQKIIKGVRIRRTRTYSRAPGPKLVCTVFPVCIAVGIRTQEIGPAFLAVETAVVGSVSA
jgi:hypothetical protein